LAPQMPYLHQPRELDATHEDVFLDRNRCMLCGRCVRASQQLDGKRVFGFERRGIHKQITVDSADGLVGTDLSAKDRAASICPTGCLMVKRQAYQVPVGQRTYDKAPIGSDVEQNKATA
jgi:[NiFe] hydrogenase diaphorase moiety small subunit